MTSSYFSSYDMFTKFDLHFYSNNMSTIHFVCLHYYFLTYLVGCIMECDWKPRSIMGCDWKLRNALFRAYSILFTKWAHFSILPCADLWVYIIRLPYFLLLRYFLTVTPTLI